MTGLRRVVLGSWIAVILMRWIAPADLTTGMLIVAFGTSVYWLSRRVTDDPVLIRLVWWSWFVKTVLAISLFYISYWSLPIFRGHQLGSGFWRIARDPSFFDWFSRWILECWRTGATIPGRLLHDQAQQLYCAGLYWFFHSRPVPVILFGIGYSTLTVLVAHDLIRRLGGTRTACRIGAGLIALWPSAVIWSTQMIKEPLVLFGILAAFWCIAILVDSEKPSFWQLWGCVGGLCAAAFTVTLFRFYVGGILIGSAILAFLIAAVLQRGTRSFSRGRLLMVALVLGGSVFVSLMVFYLKPEVGHPAWYEFNAPVAPVWFPATPPSPTSVPQSPTAPTLPTPRPLGRKSLSPITTMMAVRNGYLRTIGGSNTGGWVNQVRHQRTAIALLPRSLAAAFLEPYPSTWLVQGADVKALRQLALMDMVLIYLLIPGFLLALTDRANAHPVRLHLMIFSLLQALAIGFSIINIGTLFRLRLQYLFPLIILWASSARGTRWYAAGWRAVVRWCGRSRHSAVGAMAEPSP